MLVAVGSAGLKLWLTPRDPTTPASPIELFRQLRGPRALEPRLSGSWSYRPCEPVSLDGLCRSTTDPGDQALLLAVVQESRHGADLATRHRAEVVRLLLAPDLRGVRRARRSLEALAAPGASDSTLLADLAAVTFVDARSRDSPWNQVLALQLLLEAFADSPLPDEALFNRGLFLQALGLEKQAQAAWTECLARDPFSSWAVEAREHLQTLQEPTRQQLWSAAREQILGRHVRDAEITEWLGVTPRQAHDALRDELLSLWIAEWSPDTPPWIETPPYISNIPRLAAMLAEHTGDRLLVEALATPSRIGPAALPALRLAHRQLSEGREEYTEGHCEAARTAFAAALPVLTQTGSPMAYWARALSSSCRRNLDPGAARRELSHLLDDLSDRPYPILIGEIHRVLGTIDSQQGRFTDALERYQTALDLWVPAWGEASSSLLRLQRGEALGHLGHRQAAWSDRVQGLRGLSRAGDHRDLLSALAATGSTLMDHRLPAVALIFRQEAVIHAEMWGSPFARADSYRQRAINQGALGNHEQARLDLDRGRALADEIESPGFCTSVEIERAFEEVIAIRRESPAQALAALQTGRELYGDSGYPAFEANTLLLEARIHLDGGDLGAGEDHLHRALAALEPAGPGQPAFLEPPWLDEAVASFRQAIELRVSHNDIVGALVLAERSRVLARDGLGIRPATPPDLERLPAGTRVLFFQDLTDHILRWSIGRGEISLERLEVSPEQLVRQPEALLDTSSRELYDLLIGDTLDTSADSRLVVIPDRGTSWVPFSLLRGPAGYLVEQLDIAFAPSLGRAMGEHLQPVPDVVAIGSPAGSPHLETAFLPLGDPENEAVHIAALYPDANTLTGNGATRGSFLDVASGATLVHFAGYSSFDPSLPHRSAIHLAPGPDDPLGELDAAAVAAANFSRTHLVVLSSCPAATHFSTRHHSSAALPQAFLAAGTGAVVAASWPIDGSSTFDFMVEFHRRLAAGTSPVTALRDTQLSFLRSPILRFSDPRTWGGFRIIGSVIEETPP